MPQPATEETALAATLPAARTATFTKPFLQKPAETALAATFADAAIAKHRLTADETFSRVSRLRCEHRGPHHMLRRVMFRRCDVHRVADAARLAKAATFVVAQTAVIDPPSRTMPRTATRVAATSTFHPTAMTKQAVATFAAAEPAAGASATFAAFTAQAKTRAAAVFAAVVE